MASFTKRANGWRAQVRRKGISRSADFRTKAEAAAWAAKLEGEILSGTMGTVPKIPFSDLIIRYLKEITPKKRSAKQEDLRLRRLLKEPIASVLLPDLNVQHFVNWRDGRLNEVGVASVLREWVILSNLINVSINQWQILTVNHLKAVPKPAVPAPRTQRFSNETIEALIYVSGYSPDREPKTQTSRVGAAMLFAIETAMRAGEICNLTWEHIHFERRVAHLPVTKNGYPRDVPLSREAMRILEQLIQMREGESVFQLKSALLDGIFRKLKKQALIEDLHFHDTRREALTRLATKVDVMTLAKISGHRDLRILQNTYYAPKMDDVAILLD